MTIETSSSASDTISNSNNKCAMLGSNSQFVMDERLTCQSLHPTRETFLQIPEVTKQGPQSHP